MFARQQIREGAQFIGIGDAAASLVSPRFYKELILPAEQRLIDEIHKNGARAKLHICGKCLLKGIIIGKVMMASQITIN